MSAVEEIREEAALMRSRASNDLTPGTWEVRFQCPDGKHHHDWDEVWIAGEGGSTVAVLNERYTAAPRDAEHIASWHPVVARAVADLLDTVAEHIGSHACEAYCELDGCDESKAATALARVYLGLSS